jgi:3-oxoacyl-[acyl-carrier protein] reductase
MAAKVALVTGGSRGIGRAIAERLGADGASMIVNYRTERDAADQVVRAIQASGGQATAVQADVTDTRQLVGLFDAAERHYGGVDIVIGNAGVTRISPIAETTDEDYERVFSTNTRATFTLLREAARRVRDGGRVVVVSSGLTVARRAGYGIYAASKAAGQELVRYLATELGPRAITVNSVLPGLTRTDAFEKLSSPAVQREFAERTPLGRLGEPADIADVVGFLASDAGRWVTGQALHACGGIC